MIRPSLVQMRSEVRSVGDFNDTGFITDPFLTYALNAELGELYDLLAVCFPDSFAKEVDVPLVTGTEKYDLPSDHHSLIKVFHVTAGGAVRAMAKLQVQDLDMARSAGAAAFLAWPGESIPKYRQMGSQVLVAPASSVATGAKIRFQYIPQFKELESNLDEPHISVPIAWRDYPVIGAVIRCVAREEGDPSVWMAKKAEIKARILAAAPLRDLGGPDQVIDVHRRNLYGETD